jgi:hypothetical protein
MYVSVTISQMAGYKHVIRDAIQKTTVLHGGEPEDFIWQRGGALPHPRRWIGRGDRGDLIFCPWPAWSPDLTPCDYFLWGYVKGEVFVPPPPASTPDLLRLWRRHTRHPDMLVKVWQELDYRLDVCRVSKGAHTEHS